MIQKLNQALSAKEGIEKLSDHKQEGEIIQPSQDGQETINQQLGLEIILPPDTHNIAQKSVVFAPPICFPQCSPPGYEYFPDEVIYNPQRHLALENPTKIYRLADSR